MKTIDEMINSGWFAGAIKQRHELDALAHSEGRGHQMVNPAARDTRMPGSPSFTLTPWDIDFIGSRVRDAIEQAQKLADEGVVVLEVDAEEQTSQELEARCSRDYGMSYSQVAHALMANLTAAEGDDEATKTAQGQIDYLGRVVKTVQGEVDAKRELAQQHVDENEQLKAVTLGELVTEYLQRVERELVPMLAEPAAEAEA